MTEKVYRTLAIHCENHSQLKPVLEELARRRIPNSGIIKNPLHLYSGSIFTYPIGATRNWPEDVTEMMDYGAMTEWLDERNQSPDGPIFHYVYTLAGLDDTGHPMAELIESSNKPY